VERIGPRRNPVAWRGRVLADWAMGAARGRRPAGPRMGFGPNALEIRKSLFNFQTLLLIAN
jgi:hypothetical protein